MNKKILVGASLVAALSAAQFDARAAQVNSSAAIFQPNIGTVTAVKYISGIATNFSAGPITMVAAIPRAPGVGDVTVFVDGYSIAGNYSCTVTSQGFASKSFVVASPPGNWTRVVNFAAAEAPSSAYFAISCTVPADGAFKGLTITG